MFYRQCRALEKHVPDILKKKELENIDGGLIWIYETDGAQIIVKNDFYIGGVFVDSEIELTQFFKN